MTTKHDQSIGVGDASHREGGAAPAVGAQLVTALASARWVSGDVSAEPPSWSDTAAEQFQLVKRGDRRAIYRADLPHGSVHVKHRWSRGRLGRLVDWLRGSPSRREFLHAREAARRGVPTTDCLAFGESNGDGAAADFLVTRTLPGAVSLELFLSTHSAEMTPAARNTLAEALAELCARAHDAGLEHHDLHAGNVLVVWTDHARPPDLRLIDLDRARLGRPLNWRSARRNLAMLLCGLHHAASPRDCWRFWRAYRASRPALAVDARRGAREIWRRGMDRVWRVLRDRDRRALRNNREFMVQRAPRGVILAVRNAPLTSAQELLQSPNRIFGQPGADALKLSYGSVVVRASLAGGAPAVVLKRIRAKCLWKRLLAPFRPSRARTVWLRGHALLARGVATARPLVVLEPRPASWLGESYLSTEWLPGAENLHLYLWRVAALPDADRSSAIRHSAAALGQLLGRMHRYGVAHRDLKGCNLAAAERDGTTTWYVLDLDGVRLRRSVLFSERARDLARLAVSLEIHPCVSRTDRLRFLRSYRQAAGSGDDVHDLWRAIAGNCLRELNRLARRGRNVA